MDHRHTRVLRSRRIARAQFMEDHFHEAGALAPRPFTPVQDFHTSSRLPRPFTPVQDFHTSSRLSHQFKTFTPVQDYRAGFTPSYGRLAR
eukprot:2717420-Pyramimonas_sp.AAC.1